MDTPCNKKCKISSCGKFCESCGRTVEEIGIWPQMTDEERAKRTKELRRKWPKDK